MIKSGFAPLGDATLRIRDLHVSIGSQEILTGVDLVVKPGEVHAIMGPNGSGKTTLASTIMGKAGYSVTRGSISLGERNLTQSSTYERSRAGLFLISQYPAELPGISFVDLAAEVVAQRSSADAISSAHLSAEAEKIGLRADLLDRSVNLGFSGGEKKRAETMQLAVFGARYAILDELDSGLDIDALRAVAMRIASMVASEGIGVIAITHYSRLLSELAPDFVHVFSGGKIVRSGGHELAFELEKSGYAELGRA